MFCVTLGAADEPSIKSAGATRTWADTVGIDSVPGIHLDDASRASELSLHHLHAGAVVLDLDTIPTGFP